MNNLCSHSMDFNIFSTMKKNRDWRSGSRNWGNKKGNKKKFRRIFFENHLYRLTFVQSSKMRKIPFLNLFVYKSNIFINISNI